MKVHIVHDGTGTVASVHRTVDGAAHQLSGHAEGATLPGGEPLTIESLDRALDENPVVRIGYASAPGLVLERHSLLM